MIRLPFGHQKQVALTIFRWGISTHLRLHLTWWHAVLRAERKRNAKRGRPLRHYYLSAAFWKTSKGVKGIPVVFGIGVFLR